jgi:lysophospholipase L1-like esterase
MATAIATIYVRDFDVPFVIRLASLFRGSRDQSCRVLQSPCFHWVLTEQLAAVTLTRPKRVIFALVAIALPFVLIGLLELGLRLGGYGQNRALFIPAPFDSARYLIANPRFAARYFPGDPSPPTPPVDPFLKVKPANAFRIFALGESTTAGFPFPANGTFSRVLADALRDALPDVTVEVVNVGIPATNSFALLDELPDILAQQPDAVVIYAGHNEYYGALGAASTVRLGDRPGLVRMVLHLKRFRIVQLFDGALRSFRKSPATTAPGLSRMEELAGSDIRITDDVYANGRNQFRENIDIILRVLQSEGVPAYIGSLAANLRDQKPFGSDTGTIATNADAAFVAAHAALDAGDAKAQHLFVQARDLDVVRFRAPSEFNTLIQSTAVSRGAIYVPVAEAFSAASPDGVPGDSLFFEHVHPRPRGTALIARAFFDALARQNFHGRAARPLTALWSDYERRMALTGLDTAVATIVVEALRHRWPFAPRGTHSNYLTSYTPKTLSDSLALAVATGRENWVGAKVAAAARFEQRGQFTDALAEYGGLMRDQPWNESPFRFGARAALAANRLTDAQVFLERAYALQPTPFTCLALGRLVAADSTQLPRAAALLQQAMQLGGFNPDAAFQLSLVFARLGNVTAARAAAASVYRAAPNHPGLANWMKLLQVR